LWIQSTICLDAYFHLFWEKKVVHGQEIEFIDPCFKTFKFKFDVKPNATTILCGPIGKMFKCYNMKDEVYLHMNYVSKNVFLYRLFSLEGIEIDYSTNVASSSGTANIPADVANQESDHSLVKCLSAYDVGASSLVLDSVFLISVYLFDNLFYCAVFITFLLPISVS